jgi:hypothetical protein
MDEQKTRQYESASQRISFSSLVYFSVFLMLATLAFFYEALAFRGNSARDPEQLIAELSEKLRLTDAQVEQIRPIIENQMEQREEIFEKYSSQGRQGRPALRQEMRDLRKDTHSQITSLLTEEQIAEYEAFQQERFQKRRQRGRMNGERAGSRRY